MKGSSGKFKTLWETWDEDGDGYVTKAKEFKKMWRSMNLDTNPVVTIIEVEAYFNRNKYLVCRPFAADIIARFDKEKEKLDKTVESFFELFDTDGDQKLTETDIKIFIDTNTSNEMDLNDWDFLTDVVFWEICTSPQILRQKQVNGDKPANTTLF